MSLKLRSVLVALVTALALGCHGSIADAASKGRTAVAITRTNDFLYLAAPAAIEINGTKVASLGRGESFNGQITPGPTVVTVSTWSSPGSSSYRFNAVAGRTYRMIVGPRGKNYAAVVVGGLVGAAIEGGGAFEVVPAP